MALHTINCHGEAVIGCHKIIIVGFFDFWFSRYVFFNVIIMFTTSMC